MDFLDITVSFVTLTILEVILGIDNLVFLAVISSRLPLHQQKLARQLGLTFAWVTRLILLASALWLTKLTQPLFSLFALEFSGRDLFLIAGGMFLLYKATQEIHAELEPVHEKEIKLSKKKSFLIVVTQIAILDIIFSLDSVLTAIGLTNRFSLMAGAITIAILAMIFASEPLTRFIHKHPTVKILALSFLIMIGMVLVADGFGYSVPKGYIYFAMAFSLFVEWLNHIAKNNRK